MKLTKKQLSALQRIVGREQTRYDETQVDDCKKIIREWRDMKNLGKPLFPKITVTTKDENDAPMTSYFDAYRYLDILEAVGPYRNIYMGSSDTMRTPYPCLLVYKRCGRDEQDSVNWDEPAFLLPCRP